jgi:uncharacterized membrane protein YeiB
MGQRGRLDALDLARVVALAGMLVVHLVAPDGGVVWTLWDLCEGRAMPLFMVLAGAGSALLAARSPRPVGETLGRAAALAVIGLVMVDHVPLIAVVVHYYGLLLVVGVALRRCGPRVLALLALAVTAAGAFTWAIVAPELPSYGGWSGWSAPEDAWPLVADLTISGYYPLLPTLAFFLTGMILVRLDLRRPTTLMTVAGIGAAAAFAAQALGDLAGDTSTGWRRLFDDAGHSNMPAWVVGATGSSLVVIACCGIAAEALPGVVRRVAVLGRMTLTVYVAHGIALWLWWQPDTGISRRGPVVDLVVTAVGLVGAWWFALGWTRRFGHGPVEAVVRAAGRLTAGRAGPTGPDRSALPPRDASPGVWNPPTDA